MKYKIIMQDVLTDEPSLPELQINIATVGHVDHGKTTLTAAITRVLNYLYPKVIVQDVKTIDNTKEERERGITINARTVKYQIIVIRNGIKMKISFAHTDAPGHQDYVKNMVNGVISVDTAIIVVCCQDGLMPQTREHVKLLAAMGFGNNPNKGVYVFYNKVDMGDDFLPLVQEDMEALLKQYNIRLIYSVAGSGLRALNDPIDSNEEPNYPGIVYYFIKQIGETIPEPIRDINKPFGAIISEVHTIAKRGTVVTFTILYGYLGKGKTVIIYCHNKQPIKTVVLDIEAFHQSLETAKAGDNVGVLLRTSKDFKREDIARGDVICEEGAVKLFSEMIGEFYLDSQRKTKESEETSGRIVSGFKPQIYYKGWSSTIQVDFVDAHDNLDPNGELLPTQSKRVKIKCERPFPVFCDKEEFNEVCHVIVRESNKTIGNMVLTPVLTSEIKVEVK